MIPAWKRATFIGLSPAFRIAAARTRFVIAATPRTGSSLLENLLHHHPGVRCDGEVLGSRPRWPLRAVRGRAVRAHLEGSRAYGFKLVFTPEQWDNRRFGDGPTMLRRLHRAGYSVLVVRRRNLLAQAVSLLLAERFGFHGFASGPRRWKRVALDPELVLVRMVELDKCGQWLTYSAGELPVLELMYEEDLEDPRVQQLTIDRVTDALGLPRGNVTTDLVRQADPLISARVSNLESIISLLERSKYAEFTKGPF